MTADREISGTSCHLAGERHPGFHLSPTLPTEILRNMPGKEYPIPPDPRPHPGNLQGKELMPERSGLP
jgi:hypothetical protein